MEPTVLITGAASEIGQAIIKKFLGNGYRIIATEIEEQVGLLMTNLEEVPPTANKMVDVYPLNLEKEEEIHDFTNKILLRSPIHILVNVAGINILKKFFEWEAADLRKVMNINWVGTFLLTQAVAERMVLNSIEGSITTIASQHGMVANYERFPYCVSKAGLIELTKVLALELAPFRIRVNCISPTYVLTNKNKHILQSNQYVNEELAKIPLGTYATPDDIAAAVEYLNSSASRMVTGHNLVIDGGWTIQ
ncbi:SDR family NAD(P)-dependent oxidoreductase [Bacillus kwashiorkori]|uniref:SDR family NAD(P)-dependent oxidoreductase n=1 Tax=Bacillus kwashiorkori TaxID=1522318 RepID=UPI00078364A6|nr:SDR family oxidoreductase [Bacillus kwashiorkori]